MAITLGPHQYGKAQTRVVRIYRDNPLHQIRDLNVSTSLRGDFGAAYSGGDQSQVLPTDSQKNACYALAKDQETAEIEDYALALARHFVDDIAPVQEARVDVDEYLWERIATAQGGHPHAFARAGRETRTASAIVSGKAGGQQTWVLSGLTDLVVLKSTDSEFSGFLTDDYTTLAPASDRVLATSLTVTWRHHRAVADWAATYATARGILLERFALLHSRALQQSLWDMGRAVLAASPGIAEIRLSAPNKHHYLADLAPFGLDNPGEVFRPDDRPYGLIQCALLRDDAPPAGPAWERPDGFC
jgi:urate oxidase